MIEFKAAYVDPIEGPMEISTYQGFSVSHDLHYDNCHKIYEIPLYPYSKKKIGAGNKYIHKKSKELHYIEPDESFNFLQVDNDIPVLHTKAVEMLKSIEYHTNKRGIIKKLMSLSEYLGDN